MASTQLATRIDSKIKKALDTLCEHRGLKVNRFIEEAILDKLEELEDSEDIAQLRKEKTRPLSAVLKELKADGKL